MRARPVPVISRESASALIIPMRRQVPGAGGRDCPRRLGQVGLGISALRPGRSRIFGGAAISGCCLAGAGESVPGLIGVSVSTAVFAAPVVTIGLPALAVPAALAWCWNQSK